MLPERVQSQLAEDYERVELEVIGEGKHEQFHAMLDRLEAAYVREETPESVAMRSS